MDTAPAAGRPKQVAGRSSPLRFGVWLLHVALPMLGLWLLVEQPEADLRWENHEAHFWLVSGVAAINVVLALRIVDEAGSRRDGRLFLVALAFFASAAFLALHALATPGVILDRATGGFNIATPVGLMIAGVLALVSSFEFPADASQRIMRYGWLLFGALATAVVAWCVVSLLELPPLDDPIDVNEIHGRLVAVAIAGSVLYGLAALRYFTLYRRRPAVMLLSLITAFVLLAEALVAVAYARNWQATWWEWHILMAAGFLLVAYSAHVQYAREGAPDGLFESIALERTLQAIRDEYDAAVEAFVVALREHAEADRPVAPATAALAARFNLTDLQRGVLERAAHALAADREQIDALNSLVAIGRQARVLLPEEELLAGALRSIRSGMPRAEVGLALVQPHRLAPVDMPLPGVPPAIVDGAVASLEPRYETADGEGVAAYPLVVKEHAAGVMLVRARGELDERERSLFASLASQLGIALENARLYRQIEGLFRSYMSPQVATALIADPSQAELGGGVQEVSVLFADLTGFTTYSERSSPAEVVGMLNDRFSRAVPIILAEGGTIAHFAGDAVMALFNAPARQPDHALRGARAALAMQRAMAELGDGPRFRIGLNTGEALVGNIGSDELRHFTAIGDTVNVASRLETSAEPGQVMISEATRGALGERALVEPAGELQLKGKGAPVAAYVLRELR